MGKHSRTKGHAFEREVAVQFREELGFEEARRQLEYHAKDALGVDLQGTEPFAVQCKRHKDYAPISAIEEIKREHDGQIRLLITKADKKETMCVIAWSDLKKILAEIYKA